MKRRLITGPSTFHYVTFTCKGRRQLLITPAAKQIVIHVLSGLVSRARVRVSGFVIMPDHVHAVLWFDDDHELAKVIQAWKSLSSRLLKEHYWGTRPDLLKFLERKTEDETITNMWERKYYDFNLLTPKMLRAKLNYIHENPVRKDLAAVAQDYRWSSAPWYYLHQSVGVNIEPGF